MKLPICAKCGATYRARKNDIRVVTYRKNEEGEQTENEIWCADLLECPICHHEIVWGFGYKAWKNYYEEDFIESLKGVIEREYVVHCFE